MRILEIGCGRGRHTNYLQKKFNAQVVGIDLDQDSIDFAIKAFPSVKFHQMSAEKLDFPSNSFEKIYAYDVLEHVDDLEATVSEIQRVLVPGGQLIINVPSSKSEKFLTKLRPSYPQEMHHVRVFDGQEMQVIFESKGFTMTLRRPEGFTDHAILYYLFTKKNVVSNQLGIGNWRDSWTGRIIFLCHAITKPSLVFQSGLKYVPIWIVTLPIGFVINSIGNRFLPKSIYYEFKKNRQ